MSKSPLPEKMGKVQSGKIHPEKQCDLDDRHRGRRRVVLDSAGLKIVTPRKKCGSLGPHMTKSLLIFGMTATVYQPGWPPIVVAVRPFAIFQVLPASDWRRAKMLWYLLHFRFESDLNSRFEELSMGFAGFGNEAVGLHCSVVVDLVLLASDGLELK